MFAAGVESPCTNPVLQHRHSVLCRQHAKGNLRVHSRPGYVCKSSPGRGMRAQVPAPIKSAANEPRQGACLLTCAKGGATDCTSWATRPPAQAQVQRAQQGHRRSPPGQPERQEAHLPAAQKHPRVQEAVQSADGSVTSVAQGTPAWQQGVVHAGQCSGLIC